MIKTVLIPNHLSISLLVFVVAFGDSLYSCLMLFMTSGVGVLGYMYHDLFIFLLN